MRVMARFVADEDGALTVDWVVMAAAVVGLGVATVSTVRSGTQALGSDVATGLTGASVVSLGNLGDDGYVGPRALSQGTPRVEVATACPRGSGVCFNTTITTASYTMADGTTWQSVTYMDDLPDSEPFVIWYDGDGAVVDAPRIDPGAEVPAPAPPGKS